MARKVSNKSNVIKILPCPIFKMWFDWQHGLMGFLMAHARDQIKIADGRITLYKRDDVKDNIWHIRIKMPSKKTYVRRTTGETDFEKATQKAFEILGELNEREKNNLPLSKRTFNDICSSYLRGIENDLKNNRILQSRYRFITGTIRLYFNPYFGSKDIGNIRKIDIINYRRWRMNYWIDGPGAKDKISISEPPSNMFFDTRPNQDLKFTSKKKPGSPKIPASGTMALEWTIFRAIMIHGVEHGTVNPNNIAMLTHDKVITNKRPIFTNLDYRTLYLFMRKWIKEDVSPRQKEIRSLLRDYILIMANSGLRNGEARYLRWADVSVFKKDGFEWVTLNVRGKTGQRIVVCQPNTMRYFNRIKKRKINTEDNDYVFCYSDGKPIDKLIGYELLLKNAGVLYDAFGQKRTIYSLRHSYATFRIQNGTNIYWLKKNMGTSIEMIEKHYGQTTVLQAIEFETGFRNKKKLNPNNQLKTIPDSKILAQPISHNEYFVDLADILPTGFIDTAPLINDIDDDE